MSGIVLADSAEGTEDGSKCSTKLKIWEFFYLRLDSLKNMYFYRASPNLHFAIYHLCYATCCSLLVWHIQRILSFSERFRVKLSCLNESTIRVSLKAWTRARRQYTCIQYLSLEFIILSHSFFFIGSYAFLPKNFKRSKTHQLVVPSVVWGFQQLSIKSTSNNE